LILVELGRLESRRVLPHHDDVPRPRTIYGIDFSGALDAGRKIWIAAGTVKDGVLAIGKCDRAGAFTGARWDRDACLEGLRHFIERQRGAAIGLDFPFGLPTEVLPSGDSWEDFILSFDRNYASPQDFRTRCFTLANSRELKRHTEREHKTPWSPYNLRLYRQSYYGMGQLLAPLVRRGAVCVLPMQRPVGGKPWLLEVCPASTLKKMRLYKPYKVKGDEGKTARGTILDELEDTGLVSVTSPELREKAIGDRTGDALDSIIAAFATFRVLLNPPVHSAELISTYAREGYVYA
jgi:hypothetical protein